MNVSGEACSGLASGFGSIWLPLCGKAPKLVRIDHAKNTIITALPISPAGAEGGITASNDGIWTMTDKTGTLNRIDPSTNRVRQKISVSPGSYNPLFSHRIVWVTGVESRVLTALDAPSDKVLESVPVGPKPRFLTAGGGSIWTLNHGDGTVSRVEEKKQEGDRHDSVGHTRRERRHRPWSRICVAHGLGVPDRDNWVSRSWSKFGSLPGEYTLRDR
jgi:virginiamycin B lyase